MAQQINAIQIKRKNPKYRDFLVVAVCPRFPPKKHMFFHTNIIFTKVKMYLWASAQQISGIKMVL